MIKTEWLAEKCGFYKQGCCWHRPDPKPTDSCRSLFQLDLPDFENSLDALSRWVFPSIPGLIGYNAEIVRPEKSTMLWGVTLYGLERMITGCSYEPTLVGACFEACCEALGWEEPEGGN